MTIKDLAAKTGYAVGTVSRVLNNHPNVSEKARAAILAAVEESGFQLNVNAKQLKQVHATTILVIVKGTGNVVFFQMVEQIQNLLARTRYPLHVEYMHGADNEVRRAAVLAREKKALGVIFLGGNLENFRTDFAGLDLPGVLVTNDASDLGNDKLSSVYVDDRRAARQAVETLISLGHEKICVVGGHRHYSDTSRKRWEGTLDAMQAHGLTMDPEADYATAYFSPEGGSAAVEELLERKRAFTAIFAMSDLMAIGAIRTLRDNGLRVPEDVSVMGFDGLTIGEYTVPRLCTIAQDVQELAERSIRMLLENIAIPQPPRYETVPVRLEWKESAKSAN